jgi:hypothetical protein
MFIYIHILSYYKLFLYFNLSLSVMLDSLYGNKQSCFPASSIIYQRNGALHRLNLRNYHTRITSLLYVTIFFFPVFIFYFFISSLLNGQAIEREVPTYPKMQLFNRKSPAGVISVKILSTFTSL